MRRVSVALGILGLAWAAAVPASAQKTMQLFGKTYTVECATRAQTYKKASDGKEVKIVLLPNEGPNGELMTQKAFLEFVPGADASQDRLLVAAHQESGYADILWHGVYSLKGADANGNFTPASATLTENFGGVGDLYSGGRAVSIHLINEVNTGVKKDRNLIMAQWAGGNAIRIFDLDSMNPRAAGVAGDAVFATFTSSSEGEEGVTDNFVFDENLPTGNWISFAPLPVDDKKTVLVIASEATPVEISMWDTSKDTAHPVKSDLSAATASGTNPLPADANVHSIIHYKDNEYWMIVSNPAPNTPGTDLDVQDLYRVQLTLPANPAAGKAGDIKATVLEKASLLGTPLETSPIGVSSVTKGREVAPGLFRLYFATVDGQICVASPQP